MLHRLKLERWPEGGRFNGRALLFLSVLDLGASLALRRLVGRKHAKSTWEVQRTSTAFKLPQPDSHLQKVALDVSCGAKRKKKEKPQRGHRKA